MADAAGGFVESGSSQQSVSDYPTTASRRYLSLCCSAHNYGKLVREGNTSVRPSVLLSAVYCHSLITQTHLPIFIVIISFAKAYR